MARTKLSTCAFVELGYGQVEPNLLSAQRTGQIYAQLPAAADITVLENGQFAKYNYADGVVDFAGEGEWMLVYNEVKIYRDYEGAADFAMIKENYAAHVYSPIDGNTAEVYQGVNVSGAVTPADPYEVDSTANPFTNVRYTAPGKMPTGSTMVPRVFKTNVGDIFTTNTVMGAPKAGDTLTPGATGILEVTEATEGMLWEVVKVYTLPDRQKAVKIMRIA